MPDDQWCQVSGPVHQSLCSTTSTSHTLAMSRPGATPEPRSLPSQNSEAVDAGITWPVPQVMVYYDGMGFACGRQAITDMGKKGFLEWMFQRFLWTPKPKYDLYRTFYFDSSRFSKETDILGTFYHIHGVSDADPVILSELGWAEMMQNVVKLEVVYVADEGQGQSAAGKQG